MTDSPLATLRAQLEQLPKSRLWVNPEKPLEMVLLADVLAAVDALLRPSRPPESCGSEGHPWTCNCYPIVIPNVSREASRPPEEPTFPKPAWYMECRLHGHDADSVNVREAGGTVISCRIYRCKECDRHETVEPVAASREAQEPGK